MSNFIIVAGQDANHFQRVAAGNVTTSDADSLFPASNLAGSNALEPWRPFRHATPPVADRNVTIDLCPTVNGGGELASMSGWTENNVGASNDCTNVSSPVNSGARGFQMHIVTTGGSNKAELYQDTFMRAGEQRTFSVALRGDGTRIARARWYCVERGEYLTSGGAWTTTPTDYATRTAATYATTTIVASCPAYSVQVPLGTYTLRQIAYVDGAAAGDGYMDDFYSWPSVDGAAIIGHNVAPAISAFTLRRDTAAFAGAGTLEATMTVYYPTFYSLLGTIRTDRYWRFLPTGTNPSALWYGQLWLYQKYTASRNPNYGVSVSTTLEQTRQQSTAGAEKVYSREDIERREFSSFPISFRSASQWQAARDRIYRQSGFGLYPALLIHDDADVESCAMVRTGDGMTFKHAFQNVRDSSFSLSELSFPTFVG